MSTFNLQQRWNDQFGYVRQGKIIEGINEFYDKDTVMQDNANPSTKGLAANVEWEKQSMSGSIMMPAKSKSLKREDYYLASALEKIGEDHESKSRQGKDVCEGSPNRLSAKPA